MALIRVYTSNVYIGGFTGVVIPTRHDAQRQAAATLAHTWPPWATLVVAATHGLWVTRIDFPAHQWTLPTRAKCRVAEDTDERKVVELGHLGLIGVIVYTGAGEPRGFTLFEKPHRRRVKSLNDLRDVSKRNTVSFY